MAWNQGTEQSAARPQPKSSRGLLAGLLVIVLAGCVAYLFFGLGAKDGALKRTSDADKSKMLADVGANVKKAATANEAEEPKVEEKQLTPEEAAKVKERAEKIAVIKRRQVRMAEARKKMEVRKQPYEIFEHGCENRIASLLMMEPGTPILVPPNYAGRFEEDFKNSCKEPIVIKDDDSEYVKHVKQAMIDCKIDLCNRMANGEKLADILTETHRELRKLGEVKEDIMRMAQQEIRKNAKSAEEVDTLIAAANKMLEAKGIAPMKDNPILRRNLHRIAERNAQK